MTNSSSYSYSYSSSILPHRSMIRALITLLKWPFLVLDTLRSIDARLRSLDQTSDQFRRCISSSNHRNQHCIKTSHWNDS